jgi:hypothetical protein
MDNNQVHERDWTVTHYNELLKYRGQWVLYSNDLKKIIAHNNSLAAAKKQAIDAIKSEDFTFFYMKPEWGRIYCL